LATDDAPRIEEALRIYRKRYGVIGLLENRVYAGLPGMLADLKVAGCQLFIATSKPSLYAQKIIRHFGLTEYFAAVYGSELNGSRENKGDLLRFLLDSECLDSRRSAMVGDRSHDMLAAKIHGLCAAGVTWGYGSRQELKDAGADAICASPGEVVRFLTQV
jgi:phosphoglycolate phosphatase